MSRRVAWIFAGSAAGGAVRYGASAASLATMGPLFPLGTLLANVVGSLLLGVVVGISDQRYLWLTPNVRALLTTGFCGGLTTYSFFSWQTVIIWNAVPALAVLYVTLTLLLGVGAAWVGMRVGKRTETRRSL